MKFSLQRNLRRGRTADRIGLLLFVTLLVILVASLYHGVLAIPAS